MKRADDVCQVVSALQCTKHSSNRSAATLTKSACFWPCDNVQHESGSPVRHAGCPSICPVGGVLVTSQVHAMVGERAAAHLSIIQHVAEGRSTTTSHLPPFLHCMTTNLHSNHQISFLLPSKQSAVDHHFFIVLFSSFFHRFCHRHGLGDFLPKSLPLSILSRLRLLQSRCAADIANSTMALLNQQNRLIFHPKTNKNNCRDSAAIAATLPLSRRHASLFAPFALPLHCLRNASTRACNCEFFQFFAERFAIGAPPCAHLCAHKLRSLEF